MKKYWMVAGVAAAAALTLFAGAVRAAPASGEVRRIDKDGGKITLRHGGVPELQLSAMTMVFRVADPKLLDAVKPGEKIQANVEKVDGQYTITSIQGR